MVFYSFFRDDPRIRAVGAGTELFHQGDLADLMYVMIKGEARILVGDRVVEILGPGAIAGEMALIDGQPRSATVEALADCEFVCVDEKRFAFLVAETPGFALGVMKVLAERLQR